MFMYRCPGISVFKGKRGTVETTTMTNDQRRKRVERTKQRKGKG